MEDNLIYAPIDEKNICSDFLNEFMESWDEYCGGASHVLIGAPTNKKLPYICKWNHNNNFVRFTPLEILRKATLADNQRLADDFVRFVGEGNDGDLKLIVQVTEKEVWINFYFIER